MKSLLYDDILYQYVTMNVSETPLIIVHAAFLLLGLIKITVNSTPKHVKKPTIMNILSLNPVFYCSVM
jgi:hypothetical protein